MKDKVEEILKERQLQYGDAEVNFATVGRIWGALTHQDDLSPVEVATFMIAWKMARAFANPAHEDSWHDLAGYVTLATEIASQLWEGTYADGKAQTKESFIGRSWNTR